jgi:hypothetical protein
MEKAFRDSFAPDQIDKFLSLSGCVDSLIVSFWFYMKEINPVVKPMKSKEYRTQEEYNEKDNLLRLLFNGMGDFTHFKTGRLLLEQICIVLRMRYSTK